MKINKDQYSRIIRYGIFGIVSAGIEFLSFLILNAHFSLYVASVGSFMMGLISSFLFNKYVVFRKSGLTYREVVQFFVLGVTNSQISSLLTIFLAGFVSKTIAKILSIGLIAMWNYLIMNKIIFRKGDNMKVDNE